MASIIAPSILSAESRIDRHQQNDIDLVDHVVEPIERSGWIEHQPRLATGVADELDGPVDMLRSFGMKTDVGCAGLREIHHQGIHRHHHQMHIDGRLDAGVAQRLAHDGTHGKIRHVVIVHDVEMDPVRTCGENRFDLFAQSRKVRGKNRGRDDDAHG